MRKIFKHSFNGALFLTLILSVPLASAAPCVTTVNWHNLSDTGCGSSSNAGVTTDVINQNIDVSGVNALVNGIHVQALTCDIRITVTNGDAVITGSGNRCDGVPTNPARLYLYAAPGRTITFQISDDLLFSGSANGHTLLDLLVTASGAGNVLFQLDGGETVSFSETSTMSGGTFFAVGMSSPASPNVTFAHSLTNPTVTSFVDIGPNSYFTYIANSGSTTGQGTVNFIPQPNTITTNLALTIQNSGAFVVGGYSLTAANGLNNPNFMITDIDFTTQAGASEGAILLVNNAMVSGNQSATLQIINSNFQCQNLQINPFCQGFLDGLQNGFVLAGPTGEIIVTDGTYIEYVGTATNTCCQFNLPDDCGNPQTLQRLRNGSALTIDAASNDTPATILLQGNSAIFFISGVDSCGNVSPDFTIDPELVTPCAGNIVLDVEGPLNLIGTSSYTNGINILSLQVLPTGCPLMVEGPGTQFPERTFNVDAEGRYLQYNAGAFLVNNRFNIFNASLIHDDENHAVYEEFNLGNPNLASDPTYIGGDNYLFFCHAGQPRPTIAFYNSAFRLNTSAAVNGVDLLVPNLVGGNNNSAFVFYNNGWCIDNNYGRNLILGTDICFEGCITGTNVEAHLNIFQEIADPTPGELNLYLLTGTNSDCITQGITGNIFGQNAIQTIYLNNATNISIGTNGTTGTDVNGNTFPLTVTAELIVDGVYFSFETKGGDISLPQASGTTGQGGIFVDALGQFHVPNNRIANIGCMVTKSHGGVIDLPENSVFFDLTVGITEWEIDLSDPSQVVIVSPIEQLSDFSLDWGGVIKEYCCNNGSTNCFVPYDIEETPAPCAAPLVTAQNLTNLPTVQGTVEQMQILRARIGDPVHLLVDGGFIRELVFLHGFNSAEAPTGFIVIQNEGYVGLGTTHKDLDSLQASIFLGVNGVMLVPNGDARVELNENVIINNVCHILSGTSFGLNQQNVITISSTTPTELRVKSTGVLDLSQFTTQDQVFELSGDIRLVLEPGARIIMGGGIFRLSGNAQIVLEQAEPYPTGTSINSTDNIRVKLSGTGTVEMTQDSSMLVGLNTYFGIETYPVCSNTTDIVWSIQDDAVLAIGNSAVQGGAFQIGDTVVTSPAQNISFAFQINGEGATLTIDQLGFLGLSVGIVDNQIPVPNDWLVSCLSNVVTCSILIQEGTFNHNQIFDGGTVNASLLAIGSEGLYTFQFNPITSAIRGGGNMVKINCFALGAAAVNNPVPLAFEHNICAQNQQCAPQNQSGNVVNLIGQLVSTPGISNVTVHVENGEYVIVINNPGRDAIEGAEDELIRGGAYTDSIETRLTRAEMDELVRQIVPTEINPTVSSYAGETGAFLISGMMAGEYLLTDPSKGVQPAGVGPNVLFNYLKTDNYGGLSLLGLAPAYKRANFAASNLNVATAGFVNDGSVIYRIPFQQGFLLNRAGQPTQTTHSLNIGAISILIDPDTDTLAIPTEIIGAGVY